MFPKHNILPADGNNPFFKEMYQKRIGFSPLVFCEFFQGMEVLQIQGKKSKEYLFALYFTGKLIGHIYLGNTYTDDQIQTMKDKFFPPTWDKIYEYMNKVSEVDYIKFDQSHYAFVFDKVLQKIEN